MKALGKKQPRPPAVRNANNNWNRRDIFTVDFSRRFDGADEIPPNKIS